MQSHERPCVLLRRRERLARAGGKGVGGGGRACREAARGKDCGTAVSGGAGVVDRSGISRSRRGRSSQDGAAAAALGRGRGRRRGAAALALGLLLEVDRVNIIGDQVERLLERLVEERVGRRDLRRRLRLAFVGADLKERGAREERGDEDEEAWRWWVVRVRRARCDRILCVSRGCVRGRCAPTST